MSKYLSGNLLGGSRAEIDRVMLDKAFVETHDFHALTSTSDFNFVVGRRGTGKSALYMKVPEFLRNNKLGYVYCKTPLEYENLELQFVTKSISNDYRLLRAINRIAWRVSLLISILNKLLSHYKINKTDSYDFLINFREEFDLYFDHGCFKRTVEIIKFASKDGVQAREIPSIIASVFRIEKLTDAIGDVLLNISKKVYFFFDGLDEGWNPEQNCTAILAGLAACASDFGDRQCGIQVILFVRDNIFRALSFFDKDFSRHIEGNTLRLRWDDSSLLHLVSNRIRKSLKLESIESNIKVWNRFARKELQNREGFISCLNYTLYRPRDLLVLLNTAFIIASRSGRNEIVNEDIEASSKQISRDRLNDLLKEYDTVFPGLHILIDSFKGRPAFRPYVEVVAILEEVIRDCDYSTKEESDFAILGSGKEAFFALYSIGFIGLESSLDRKLKFCHDGSPADIDATHSDQRTCLHPCYWKALDTHSELLENEVLLEVYDDIKPVDDKEIQDIRTKRIGQLVSELPNMPEGAENAKKFEQWVFRTIQILFAGKLSNPELQPNKDSVQRRDIVATNMAKDGFWRRILEDYASRQVIFEVKNYPILKPDDFRQAQSYACGCYGNFVVVVNRNPNDGLSDKEKGWVKEIWDNQKILIFIIPATLLARCVKKLRSQKRFDYSENQLNKRLDIFLRSYLSLKHIKRTRKKSKKTKSN